MKKWSPILASRRGGWLFSILTVALTAIAVTAIITVRTSKAGPPICDEACLKAKDESVRQQLAGTFPPAIVGTLPPGAPVQPVETPPFDTCKAMLTLGPTIPTLGKLISEHGGLQGCSTFSYGMGNHQCDQHAGGNLPVCATAPVKVLILLEAAGGTGDSGPGFLTCVHASQPGGSACGVPLTGAATEDIRTDRSTSWVFTPFPVGTAVIPYPPQAGPAPADTTGDPIGGCVGDAKARYVFRVASHTLSLGCPPPWS
jgi:hypothetical protein